MNRIILAAIFAVLVSSCGTSTASSDVKRSPVYYDTTCHFNGGYYWVGYNNGSDHATLSLNWGRESDRASLKRHTNSSYHFEGYGEKRPGLIPRHFQVVFNANFSSATVYFSERGYWVQKTVLPCR